MYGVQFFTGDYKTRLQRANAARCVAYVEHHVNSSGSLAPNYAVVITASNASATSREWGRWYARAAAQEFGIKVGGDGGIAVGGFSGRAHYNLRFTAMPAIPLGPVFVSNPQHAAWIRSDDGQARLAGVLVESIQRFFPGGGLIAFSVGHEGKTSMPNDRGAAVAGGGMEADAAEAVLLRAQDLLLGSGALKGHKAVRVVEGDATPFERAYPATDVVTWDAERGELAIDL